MIVMERSFLGHDNIKNHIKLESKHMPMNIILALVQCKKKKKS